MEHQTVQAGLPAQVPLSLLLHRRRAAVFRPRWLESRAAEGSLDVGDRPVHQSGVRGGGGADVLQTTVKACLIDQGPPTQRIVRFLFFFAGLK